MCCFNPSSGSSGPPSTSPYSASINSARLTNTFGDADAFSQLIEDVSTKLFDRLPDDTWFYPGHGDDSTIGAERPQLPTWRERGW